MKSSLLLLSAIVLLLFCSSCKKETEKIAVYDNTPYTLVQKNYTLPAPKLPADNPLTVEKVRLGKMLFYETKLSQDGTMNCASCHVQKDGFSDLNQFSTGVKGLEGKRQAMAIFNLAWHENGFFWDGRTELLRHQSILPIKDELEMNETIANVIAKLSADTLYTNQFFRAFGNRNIDENKMSLALENFMFTIISDDSKYDRFLKGTATLTASEERGRELFFAEYNEFFPETSGADCAHCHSGLNFENNQYMNNGLDDEADFTDIGREAVTGDPMDRAKFKVTSLRNIALTPPYMHDGRFNTLKEVIEHYNSDIHTAPTTDPALMASSGTGLMLTEEDIADLISFLHTLTDENFKTNSEYASPF
jgi:cytochrome c peroxidase